MSKKKIFLSLIIIIFIAALLRLYKLDSVPPAASVDEAAAGYNAYSLLRTERDEYGTKLPLIFRSFDDYKPGAFFYMLIPFIKVFGLNIVAVRLPSAIFGILTVLATYYLVIELFGFTIHDSRFRNKKITHYALLSAALLAISPWHIYLSRIGFEILIGASFFVFAILFFFKKHYFLASMFYALSFMTYQAEKIIIPTILFFTLILFWRQLWNDKKKLVVPAIVFFTLVIPFILQSIKPEALMRFKGTNVLISEQEKFNKHAWILKTAVENNDIIGQIVHNRRTVALEIISKQYFSHFNPKWLFNNSGSEPHKVPGIGLLWWWELPFIILGIFSLFTSKLQRNIKAFLFIWFLSSPLAASITTQAPHATRSFTFIPILQIFSAVGIIYFADIILKNRKVVFLTLVTLIIISIGIFYKQYFIVFPKEQSNSFQYAMRDAVKYVLENQQKYNKIIFSNQNNLYQSYMFFLYYSKYDPALYQRQGGTKSGGYAKTHKFGKYEFRPIHWEDEDKLVNILYLGNPEEIPANRNILRINYLDGTLAIKIKHK